MPILNENNIKIDCPYPQTYCAILTHKPENLVFAKKHFGDRDNRLYLSDTNVEGTMNIYQEGYDSRVFGELPAWMWLADKIREQDWVSLNAYRRKLKLGIGTLVAAPMEWKCSVLDQLANYHSPVYCDVLNAILPRNEFNLLQRNVFFPYNIAQMSGPQIKHYVSFIKEREDSFFKCLGFQPTLDNCRKFVTSEPSVLEQTIPDKNLNVEYQSRIGAFIMERLNTIYWQLVGNFVPMEVVLLENNQKI
jgi:hypothetical protein